MDVETYDVMSISLASFEQGNAKDDLLVTVRIAWTPGDGMYAEAIDYGFGGMSFFVKARYDCPLDTFVRHCVAANYTETYLDSILADSPAFEDARRHEYNELKADQAWARARAI